MGRKTVNAFICGCKGDMGRQLIDIINRRPGWRICAGYDKFNELESNFPIYGYINQISGEINPKPDIIFDFSSASATNSIYKFAITSRIPILIGTRCLSDKLISSMKSQKDIPVFQEYLLSANMRKFIENVCYLASQYKTYYIDIFSEYQIGMNDTSYYTSWALALAIKKALGNKHEIVMDASLKPNINILHIHTTRTGDCLEKHTIVFSKKTEKIKFEYNMLSLKDSAESAINAAEFLFKQKPGYYNMDNM